MAIEYLTTRKFQRFIQGRSSRKGWVRNVSEGLLSLEHFATKVGEFILVIRKRRIGKKDFKHFIITTKDSQNAHVIDQEGEAYSATDIHRNRIVKGLPLTSLEIDHHEEYFNSMKREPALAEIYKSYKRAVIKAGKVVKANEVKK